jgi:hypothetical protein
VYFVPFAFVGGLQTMQAGKVSNYDSEQDHQPERGSRLYGIFSKNVFSFWIFCWNGKKNVSLFCDKRRKFYLSFSRAGIPVIPAFFIPGKSVCRALASPGGLVNVCLSFTVTKVVLFSVCANIWYYFLYSFAICVDSVYSFDV